MRQPSPEHWADDDPDIGFLHEMASRMSAAAPLHDVLTQVIGFATAVVKCDSCFVYVLESGELVLRASKNPHPELVNQLKLQWGKGITGWVAEHREPVALSMNASADPRFELFNDLPEDYFEAFLSVPIVSRARVVGVINLQNKAPHNYTRREIRLIATIGFLVGAEIEMARLENENLELSNKLETRIVVERAKSILQRDLNVSKEEAQVALERESLQKHKSLKETAEAIVLSEGLKVGPQ